MSAGTTNSPVADPAKRLREHDEYITQQIERTRRQVKFNDLAISVLSLLIGVIVILVALVIIDHWIVGLGFWGRVCGLVALTAGCVVFVAAKILPLLVRSVNPVYAAKTIEESSPSVKNSLINFLFLRSKKDEVRRTVYEAVQRRAALDLSNTNIDTTIDRSLVIRLGYMLAVLIAIAGLYKILSPKDPLTTFARIATPWRTIARPSRVSITEITPGETECYRGETVDVTAIVEGTKSDGDVHVVYSTADGQENNVLVEMASIDGYKFTATLGQGGGLQQNLNYWVVAGDAKSADYRVTVTESPNILVKQIDYDFPAYTKLPKESTDFGDIDAVEGTKVTISAEANQPISSAYVELFESESAATSVENGSGSSGRPNSSTQKNPQPKIVRMTHRENQARVTLTLSLLPDRKTPKFRAYRVRFANKKGQKNEQPSNTISK